MNKEYKPRIEYFNLLFIVFFSLVFVLFGEFELIKLIGLVVIDFILIYDIISRKKTIKLNDTELIIKNGLFRFSKTTTISLMRIKKLTLKSTYKTRGIKIDFSNGDYKNFTSNLKKIDLLMLGNDIKSTTSIQVYVENYFKTEKL